MPLTTLLSDRNVENFLYLSRWLADAHHLVGMPANDFSGEIIYGNSRPCLKDDVAITPK